ncbi:MAG: exosortase H [Acidobacteriota bacterium]
MPVVESAKHFFAANQKALRFLSLFAAIFAISYFVFGIAEGVRSSLIKPYTALLAKAVAAMVNLFGAGATTDGTTIQAQNFSLNIAMGCDGIEAACLFLAGVLAFPTSWQARMIGLAIGIPLIQVINVLRLIALYYAGMHFPSVVEEIHIYVAQTVVIILSTAILIFWLERIASRYRTA